MGQLHWMISLLPDAALNVIYWAIIIAGITGVAASWLARWIPFYGNYAKVLKPLGIVLIVLGVYLKGGYDNEMVWRDRVAELEEKLKVAEEKSAQVNTVVEEKVVTKTKVIREKADTIVKYVDRPVIQEYDKKCPIPKEVIDIHNEATEMNLIIDRQLKEANKK